MRFRNREEAGQVLVNKLMVYANRTDVLVLALPRGGVPVAFEVAQALNAPLDIFMVRKLGLPSHKELAMGALASGNIRVLNDDVVNQFHISEEVIDAVAAQEQRELERREQLYRDHRRAFSVKDRTIILIDDGLATGSTMRAAVSALRLQNPAAIVVAVPVAALAVCEGFKSEVDEIICAYTPEQLYAVGMWYEDFSQTTDNEVRNLLARAATETPTASAL
ncbi:MAG: phosphoribosyltransferase [Methylobacter sp.]|nr:phosphoribosyltransferase [Methylobacter sp.]